MISVFGSWFGEEEIAEVTASLRSNWAGMGKKTEAFEKAMAERLGTEDFLLVNSGSNALHLAVVLLDLPPGSEIILPSFTWVACANAIMLAGHRPVFCDVDPISLNVTAATIQPHITEKTGAIMVVHYAGKMVDMKPIIDLGFPVIEDAAHATATQQNGKFAGTFGDIGVFSFDAIKNLAIGEGGGICCKDPEKMARAKRLRYCGVEKSGFQAATGQQKGRWWEYHIPEVFHKLLPTDLSAGIGLAQLKRLPVMQSKRKEIWDYYQSGFEGIDWLVRPLDPAQDETHSYFTYFIQVPERDLLAHHLLAKGIYTTFRYHPLHLNKVYGSTAQLPVSETLNQTGLNIPLHPRLSESDLILITESILERDKWGND